MENRRSGVEFLKMNEHGWREFSKHVPVMRIEDTFGIVAVRNNQFVGGVVYDSRTRNSLQSHICILDPFIIRHGFFECIFQVGFGESMQYAYGQVPSDNHKALNLNRKLGFTEKCVFEEAWAPGIDIIVMQLKRSDCRYL